ncbi:MAG TPA: Gfo/Idh/MocA family oxidoreductase [Longimicrobiales bacterium]|nr:Gfo/Idh/MocA family oxidoreductase [Longimicrobiales bacterium]
MSDRAPVRVGILGTGAIAQIVHLPILTHMEGVEVAAICDVDRDKARAIASRFGVRRVYSEDAALFGDDLDAIVICTPSNLHEAQAIAAMEAGKDVLVEKPLALTADGAQRVLDAAERTGRSVMVAMNSRYRPDAHALKPLLDRRELGDVYMVSAGWLNRRVHTVRPTWRHRRETAGGGALMDLGVQILDLCLWLLDFPRVERLVARLHPGQGMEVEDSGVLSCSLAGGLSLSIDVSWSLVAPRDRYHLDVLGTRGSASLPPLAVHRETEQGVVDVTPRLSTGGENLYMTSYRRELEAMVEICRGERRAEPPREQVELMRLMTLAYRSYQEGRELDAT